MVRLNIESCMALTLTLLPLLEKNSPSYIINVASMAGFAPIPIKNMYSATKSAVIFFSYSLHYQLKDRDINVSCLAPGPYIQNRDRCRNKKTIGEIWRQNGQASAKSWRKSSTQNTKRKNDHCSRVFSKCDVRYFTGSTQKNVCIYL
jgi:Short-chain dehydrogenases of various substrate specificities